MDFPSSRLTYFPTLLPDETVFSAITRFHKRSGLLSTHSTLELLFGCHHPQLCSDFLSVLPELSRASLASLEDLVNHHSVMPFFRSLITRQQYNSLLSSLALNRGYDAMAQLSLIANRIVTEPVFKYCPVCLVEDKQNQGVGYWHCVHQLPGMSCCVEHTVLLNEIKKSRKRLFLPPDNYDPIRVESGTGRFKYATLALDCFRQPLADLDKNTLYDSYYERLYNKGLLSDSKRIRMVRLRHELYDCWPDIFELRPFHHLKPLAKDNAYPECLFYNRDSHHHPLKHLLLIGYLFGSWENFLNLYHTPHYFEANQEKITTPAKRTQPDKKNAALRLLGDGTSLRKTAKATGMSVGTITIWANQNGIPVSTRPKKIFKHEKRDIWRKLFTGISTQRIASIHNISVGAVEGELRKYPEIVLLRKRIRYFRQLSLHRNEIVEELKMSTAATRSKIRKSREASYLWLYKHDRTWLYETVPPAIPREVRSKRNKLSSP